VSLKNVNPSLKQIAKELSKTQNSREFLIKNTREVIILCSHAIIAIHKGHFKLARSKIQRASKLLAIYRKKAAGDLHRYIITPEQELVEAFSLLAIVEKKPIPSVKSLGVSSESYVLGLLDCIGEIKRLVYDKIIQGRVREAYRLFETMENLYLLLYPFAIYDKIVKEVRRKLDVNRILIEDTKATITEEIRREKFMDALNLKK